MFVVAKDRFDEIIGRNKIAFVEMDEDEEISVLLLAKWLRRIFGQSGETEVVKNYIVNQEEHHRQRSFQDEYRYLLNKYNIDYDERFVWG
ncbi:MAG: hypothetical protein WBD22_09040 [Pyrinomonadaceae bacterium]